MNIKKPETCDWISEKTWKTLKLKEKAFVTFTHERQYTAEKMMLKLYIEDYSSFWRFKNRVKSKLSDDIVKYNEMYLKDRQSL